MDVEAVGERDGVASLQMIFDVLLVDLRLRLVRREDHDEIGFLGSGVHVDDLKAGLASLLGGLRTLAKTDAHVAAGVHEVERMGMALRAVADDGDLLALDDLRVDVLFVIDCHSHGSLSFLFGWFYLALWQPLARKYP